MPGSLGAMPVTLHDAFWDRPRRALLDRGLAHQWAQCEETGRLENFRRVARGETTGHVGRNYDDSDVFKLAEATCYGLALEPDNPVRQNLEDWVQTAAQAQADDGYLNTLHQLTDVSRRYTFTAALHELYCLGHLVEAGVAEAETRGQGPLFAIAKKVADHMVATFGPGKLRKYDAHPEAELALARMTRITGEQRYADLAAWWTKERGTRPSPYEAELLDPTVYQAHRGYQPLFFKNGAYDGTYAQDQAPLLEQTIPVGHAVRAMYLYCGAVDTVPESLPVLETIWDHLVTRRMYVTGGIGSSGHNEGFTNDFDLPNRDAYAETCAAIGLIFWAHRMSLATGDARYTDVLELALFNAALSGMSLDGTGYFYDNPLESRGGKRRQPWFECACCPPNIARLLLSLDRYLIPVHGDEITIQVPVNATVTTPGGAAFRIETEYPFGGRTTVTCTAPGPAEIWFRRPGWAPDTAARFLGDELTADEKGYFALQREFAAGDALEVESPMRPEWLRANPLLADDAGLVALRQGPIIYAFEEADNSCSPHLLRVDATASVGAAGLIEGLELPGLAVSTRQESAEWNQPTLYAATGVPASVEKRGIAIPYFAWANRNDGGMRVWIRT